MSRKIRYIEKLTAEEVRTLQDGFKYGPSGRFRQRCQCLLLSHQGKAPSEIAAIHQVNPYTVYRCFDAWEARGLVGLYDKPRSGRPVKLGQDNKDQVAKLVKKDSQDLNQVLEAVEQQLGLQMSKRTLKRFLKKMVSDGNASANE